MLLGFVSDIAKRNTIGRFCASNYDVMPGEDMDGLFP